MIVQRDRLLVYLQRFRLLGVQRIPRCILSTTVSSLTAARGSNTSKKACSEWLWKGNDATMHFSSLAFSVVGPLRG